MDLNKYLNNVAPSEPQYSKEEYAAMKKTEREAVWVQVDARMGEVLADASTLQGFLDFMSQCRNSLPNQLLLSGQNADITDARTFQQWKDAGRHIRTGEEGYTAIVGQVYENNGRKASGYNIGKVFDITQTRGRPVPPPAEYQVDELIAASIESSPVPIQILHSLAGCPGGLFFVCGGQRTRRTRCGADGKSSGQAAGNYVGDERGGLLHSCGNRRYRNDGQKRKSNHNRDNRNRPCNRTDPQNTQRDGIGLSLYRPPEIGRAHV